VTLDELPGLLRALAVRAGYAAIPGADKLGADFRDEIKHRLTALSHERGTRTPAPPGGPPAKESGALADSVTMTPASTPVVAVAPVGPNCSPRDAVQEEGGSMHARAGNSRGMVFFYDPPGWYHAQHVKVPQREYMLSTAEIVARDGAVAAAVAAAFYAALWG
jgi:hypothetical protein